MGLESAKDAAKMNQDKMSEVTAQVTQHQVAYLCQTCLTCQKDVSTPSHGNSHGLLLPAMKAAHVTPPSTYNAQDHESSLCIPTQRGLFYQDIPVR